MGCFMEVFIILGMLFLLFIFTLVLEYHARIVKLENDFKHYFKNLIDVEYRLNTMIKDVEYIQGVLSERSKNGKYK